MLLRYSLGLEEEAAAVEGAVNRAVDAGVLTIDLCRESGTGVSSREAGDAVLAFL